MKKNCWCDTNGQKTKERIYFTFLKNLCGYFFFNLTYDLFWYIDSRIYLKTTLILIIGVISSSIFLLLVSSKYRKRNEILFEFLDWTCVLNNVLKNLLRICTVIEMSLRASGTFMIDIRQLILDIAFIGNKRLKKWRNDEDLRSFTCGWCTQLFYVLLWWKFLCASKRQYCTNDLVIFRLAHFKMLNHFDRWWHILR